MRPVVARILDATLGIVAILLEVLQTIVGCFGCLTYVTIFVVVTALLFELVLTVAGCVVGAG